MHCFQEIEHTVNQGDTLFKLSKIYNTTTPAIIAMNPGIDPYNLQVGSVLRICSGEPEEHRHVNTGVSNIPRGDCVKISMLRDNMRLAWSQHVYWNRLLLISLAVELGDISETTARLLRNPGDIANIFAGYYSQETAERISAVITEHLKIGSALIIALRDGNSEEADRLTSEWYINAGEWADVFADINPRYNRDELHEMLYTHLDLTTEEVLARLAHNYQEDIDAFDQVEQEAMMMADYFSQGIIEQFPQMFA